MNNNLYFIENQGCDDTTYGLVWISDEDFPKFKSFIESLNKNSHYDCQPVICVYKINIDDLKEIAYNPFTKTYDCDVENYKVLHLNGKTYTFAKTGGQVLGIWNVLLIGGYKMTINISKTFIILTMVFCHIVDDYYLQGILASMKQKTLVN